MNWTVCSPSLALVKYWGKQRGAIPRPATSSLAIGIESLHSYCRVQLTDKEEDKVFLHDQLQDPQRYRPFFDHLRQCLNLKGVGFQAECWNDFPGSAGFASSSSGFAALAMASVHSLERELPRATLSKIAGRGSLSAARAVWGGFTTLKAGAVKAEALLDSHHWPDLRVLLIEVDKQPKPVSSRMAMERSRRESPFYHSWLKYSRRWFRQAQGAVEQRDLEQLGEIMGLSYRSMFAQMLTCKDPVLYWKPDSIKWIRYCQEARSQGIPLWETMDAGPQVKILTLKEHIPGLQKDLEEQGLQKDRDFRVSAIGGVPCQVEKLPPSIKELSEEDRP